MAVVRTCAFVGSACSSSMVSRIPSISGSCLNSVSVSTLPVTCSSYRIYCHWCSSYVIMRRKALRASVEAKATLKDTSADDVWAGVAKYKPGSYNELVSDASKALARALEDQHKRLEIEFPPLPSTISGYKGTSDEFIDANIQLALALVQKLHDAKGLTCHIVFPDMPEKRRALRVFKSALDLANCVSLGSLDDIPGGAAKRFMRRLRSAFDFDFGEDEDKQQSHGVPSLYIFVNCSTSELPDVEKYLEIFAADIPAVLFNLELDTLRADLGIFGFPPKDLQYRFLSKFLPIFYIRTRNYSKTIPAAPFVLDYGGALFRQYPGPWQVMLRQSDSSYVCVAENSQRFTLGQTKEELLTALGLQEEDGSALAFLRRGYKNSTWWEDDAGIENSSTWRT